MSEHGRGREVETRRRISKRKGMEGERKRKEGREKGEGRKEKNENVR